MALCAMKISWIVFLLFNLGACVPVKKDQSGPGSVPGLGTAGSGYSVGSSGSDFDQQLANVAHFIAEVLRFMPSRPFPREAWTSDHVPLGMVEQRPLYPSSHVVKSSNGYQRARDFSADAKYTQDIFDHIDIDGGKQDGSSKTGSKGQEGY
uniref:Uncharacterized protein n=1 Tax=Oryzias melastigma TaxID=30732 RepID=A0A3B3BZM1_ORYME